MSKTNAMAVLSAVLLCTSVAQAAPLRELVEEQRGAMADEIAKKRAESKARVETPSVGTAPAAAPTQTQGAAEDNKPRIEDVAVVAVYGEVGKLTADVSLKGGVPTAVKEGYEVMPGWYVDSITSQRVNFTRGKKRGKGVTRHIVYLSEPATVATAQSRRISSPSGFGTSLPPIVAPTPTQVSPLAQTLTNMAAGAAKR
ncbi:type IV pilus biogenesis protein PilP [Cupriavidus necator]|uniref:type IV pilus biogenesis protein PilP n=1 Tax=Cupriavidus necator TaxID=106590 RepID=UPI003ECC9006